MRHHVKHIIQYTPVSHPTGEVYIGWFREWGKGVVWKRNLFRCFKIVYILLCRKKLALFSWCCFSFFYLCPYALVILNNATKRDKKYSVTYIKVYVGGRYQH